MHFKSLLFGIIWFLFSATTLILYSGCLLDRNEPFVEIPSTVEPVSSEGQQTSSGTSNLEAANKPVEILY